MQVIGFYFTKIFSEKYQDKITAKPTTSIEFIDLKEEDVELLKEAVAIKTAFKYSLLYEDSTKKQAEVSFEGKIIISVSTREAEEIMKEWKKKKLLPNLNIFLSNVILRKCTPKTISIQDELSLPFHTPMPKLTPKKQGSP